MNEPTADEIMKMFAVDKQFFVVVGASRLRSRQSERRRRKRRKSRSSLLRNSSHGNVSTRDSGGWPTVSKSRNTTADTSLRIVRHSTISAVRNRRPTNATTTCFIPRRENGSGRLFETLIQYRLQGWVQPVY